MNESSIAVNRFGLGLRAGDQPPADGKRWLIGQFDRYNPKPPAIASAPGLVTASQYLRDYAATGPALKDAKEMQAGADGKQNPQALAAVAARDAVRSDVRMVFRNSITARAAASLGTDTPFMERLVQFWSNHFAISAEKLPVQAFAGSFEFDAIRPHLLGKFGDMLGAVERHPAMLIFLDQAQSIGPNSAFGARASKRGKQKGLNENLAREIMELHTLGVRSVYSQADVTEFARALTGWTIGGIGKGYGNLLGDTNGPTRFVFVNALHEPGSRTIIGKTYAQGGEQQANAVLATLATHPATATHIATKLARHFAGDNPPPALVRKLQTAFLESGGDLPTVYRVLVEAPETWTPQPVKFKTPWEWTISTGRALGLDSFPNNNVAQFVTQLGQQVWQPGSPAGFDDIAASWAGPDAIMRRVEAAERLAGRLRQPLDARQVAVSMFGSGLSPTTATSLARAESAGQAMALLLVSPEFMRR